MSTVTWPQAAWGQATTGHVTVVLCARSECFAECVCTRFGHVSFNSVALKADVVRFVDATSFFRGCSGAWAVHLH
eukprot:4453803-Amphidinium_carterae.1